MSVKKYTPLPGTGSFPSGHLPHLPPRFTSCPWPPQDRYPPRWQHNRRRDHRMGHLVSTWTYYQRYPNDSKSYKFLVFTLWALEAVHQAFVGHVTWFYVVQNYGHFDVLERPPVWTLSVQTTLGAFVGTIVKICFGMRVWKFSNKNYLITGLIMGMSLAQLAMAVVFTLKSFHIQVGQVGQIKTLGSAALAIGVATDIVIAASLSFFLHKMRTGYKRSDTLINRLITVSVNTGMVTSVCSSAVLYNLMPANFIFIAFYIVLSKLYSISCVGTLNTRRFIHGRGTDHEEATIPTFLMVANTLHHPPPSHLHKEPPLQIDITL
ncbi:hypothetical protein B0F90DRAFT_348925 [Multifurca ochricompacta]|uniref:DUF6534 domain-containing protein n=1 Tax=Multifurca ochricompacta TaxID=376703 RepID=A0AAD4M685_9AGAM|nr:hypothetical protein B0F90DRAFT_348925 [Multifurca ochricompacta]